MAVGINQISDNEIHVNGKLVYKDMDGFWTETIELTTQERESFNAFNNRRI